MQTDNGCSQADFRFRLLRSVRNSKSEREHKQEFLNEVTCKRNSVFDKDGHRNVRIKNPLRIFIMPTDCKSVGTGASKNFVFSIFYCSHLSLSLYKIGGGSAIKYFENFVFSIFYCSHLSLSLYKIGGGSAIKYFENFVFSIFYCSHLSLSLYKIGGSSAIKYFENFVFSIFYCSRLSLSLYSISLDYFKRTKI